MFGRRALQAAKTLGRQVLMDRCQVEQQAAGGAGVWTACAPSLEDLGPAGVDGPLSGGAMGAGVREACAPSLEDIGQAGVDGPLSDGAMGAGVREACAPSLEDLGQAGVDGPLGVDRLPLLGRDKRPHGTGFGEEDRNHLF